MSVDWDDVEGWGGRVHVSTSVPDAHDASEQRAEDGRG